MVIGYLSGPGVSMESFLVSTGIVSLAEIGDKTQLATMLFAADREVNKWIVFAGAALALVLVAGVWLPEPVVRWSDEFFECLVRLALLRYLAVAHFGRGRGDYQESEHPDFWQEAVAEVVLGEAMKPYLEYGWQPQIMAVDGTKDRVNCGGGKDKAGCEIKKNVP